MIKIKKTIISAVIISSLGISGSAHAKLININFGGLFTFTSATGEVLLNADDANNQNYGFRTNLTGSASFDTDTGAGTTSFNSFSFLGNGLSSFTDATFQAIGDSQGNLPGSLIAAQLGWNWGGTQNIPITLIWDAAGFFNAIQNSSENNWTVSSDCFNCATSSTEDWVINSPFDTAVGSVGKAPIAMTSYNTNGISLNDILPLLDDGISGSPMTTAPFTGFNVNIDITSITVDNIIVAPVPVPLPAAIYLLASGMMGLFSTALRRRKQLSS